MSRDFVALIGLFSEVDATRAATGNSTVSLNNIVNTFCISDCTLNLRHIRDRRGIARGKRRAGLHRKSKNPILCPAVWRVDHDRSVLLRHLFLYRLSSY